MRLLASLLVVGCAVSLAPGQWIERTIYLPDSLSGLDSIRTLQFHSPNSTIYVGGSDKLVAVDAATHTKLAWTASPGPLDLMCSITTGNKLYCTSLYRESVWVVDCATNSFVAAVPLDGRVWAMCYAVGSNKVYVTCPADTLVNVIDCEADSVVARIHLESWPSALCYNSKLNRVYVTTLLSDEVAAIDCAADTVVSTVWVRGVEPTHVCYDSTTNRVYTVNYASGTSSDIDCAGDSLMRVVVVGARPEQMVVGPAGKVYCGGYYDSVVTAIEPHGTHEIPVGRHLSSMSYDPVNNKVYCATSGPKVVVVDAVGDTVIARVWVGADMRLVCYDPVDTSNWAAGSDVAALGVIDGATDRLTDVAYPGFFAPRSLCYNSVDDHLYCLGNGLAVIDCDSNRVLRILLVGKAATDSIIWNSVNNKIYLSNPAENTVMVLDGAGDSMTAIVQIADSPGAMRCSDDGKVYLATKGGVAVIDPDGDSIRTVVVTPYDPRSLCYDRTDNKMYVGLGGGMQVSVIDVTSDSVLANVPVSVPCDRICWNPNHDKAYVYGPTNTAVVVVDCTVDTVLRTIGVVAWEMWISHCDSVCDKVYFGGSDQLCIVNAATDTFYNGHILWSLGDVLDNGRPADSNSVYYTDPDNGKLRVISGADDHTLRVFGLLRTTDLAWNPAHSWVYALNPDSSSIIVISDTMLGVEERRPQAVSHLPQATVVRGALVLDAVDSRQNTAYGAELLDIAGRVAMKLQPGANDVRALAPGVYFAHSTIDNRQSTVTKVVVTR